jgi:quercetin dioxygenase-like cupin family protein
VCRYGGAVQIFDFGADAMRAVTEYGSEGFTVAPISRADGAFVACLRLEPGGRIGRHLAVNSQLLLLVEGDATVSGEDGVEVALVPGQAALWRRGESHETRSDAGMLAFVTEGRLDLIAATERRSP